MLEEGNRLLRQGALDDAARCFATLLKAEPSHAAALYHLAQIACMQGRLDDGVALARRVLICAPRHARAHNLLGQALSALAQMSQALASFDAAIAADPALADAHGNRADALAALGRKQEALQAYERAVALAPRSFANWCNRGAVECELQLYAQAVDSFDRALTLEPAHAQAHYNRGNALAALARYDEALAAFETALALAPDHEQALYNRGCLLSKLGHYRDAAAAFDHLLTMAPAHPSAIGELAACHLMTCDWAKLAAIAPRLEAAIADPGSIIAPFTLLALQVAPEQLLACNTRFVAQHVAAAPPFAHRVVAAAAGKLRIAYLGDFNRHPVSYLTAGLFERHDRSRFDVTGVALGRADGSAVRDRIAHGCDRFFDASNLSDDEVARRLHELGVHIAVDLVGHTENLRPAVLARRPAPIQVSYLGYLGTMAADFIDYIIGDPIVLPFEQQHHYVERIVQLPDCFMVHDSGQPTPATLSRREAGLPEDGFVFCSFNHSYKIRAPVFEAWMTILRAVDGSVLWLLGANPQAVANLRHAAAAHGVDPGRLIFADRVDLAAHLDRQRLADLFLDTVPYNAGATASAALWAGVPLLTCRGANLAGRMAASMLHALGLSELIADDLADYSARAISLARDRAALQRLRRDLDQDRRRRFLFDTSRFTRHLEAAYRTMWETWQRGARPTPFRVAPLPDAAGREAG